MPYIEFDKQKKTGSSKGFVFYLEKENKKNEKEQMFFNHDSNEIEPNEVIEKLDSNNKKLSNSDEKYYSFIISPSQKELRAINNDTEKLKEYVKKVMDGYALNFNKGLIGRDLLYFAKVENNRYYKNRDFEVKEGFAKQYEKKEGYQTHVHVLVSRRTKNNGVKISPKDKAKGGDNFKLPNGQNIRRGFDMNKFKNRSEIIFDDFFNYNRSDEEKYDYLRLKKHYPKEFKEKYGKGEVSLSLNTREILNKNYEDLFISRRIEEAVYSSENKETLERQLKQKGISINKQGLFFKGKEKDEKNVFNLIPNKALNVLGAYYVSKKFNRFFKGKDEHEKEFNEDKEI